jgi:hypothetical protein
MLYFKVNEEHQDKAFGGKKQTLKYVANELFTERECKKYNINKQYCTPIYVSKKDTHFLFGARFMKHGVFYTYALLEVE